MSIKNVSLKVVAVVSLLSGCSMSAKREAEIAEKLDQHAAILSAIAVYIGDLQDKGILPKPENKEK